MSCLSEKNRSRHGKWSIIVHYCAIPPSQPPFIAYNIAQYIFPTTPFIYYFYTSLFFINNNFFYHYYYIYIFIYILLMIMIIDI